MMQTTQEFKTIFLSDLHLLSYEKLFEFSKKRGHGSNLMLCPVISLCPSLGATIFMFPTERIQVKHA